MIYELHKSRRSNYIRRREHNKKTHTPIRMEEDGYGYAQSRHLRILCLVHS